MMLSAEMVNLHSHLPQPLAPTFPLLFAEDCNVDVVDRILSESLGDIIRERDNLAHTLNDIKVRFQNAGHELRAVKI